jgi:hypothetical protein
MANPGYEYTSVKQYFIESLILNPNDAKVLYEYAMLLRKHKRDSFKEYAPIFYKASQLEKNKLGYLMEAAISYYEAGNFNFASELINQIKKHKPAFPDDNQSRFWTSQTYLQLAEHKLAENSQKSIDLLLSIKDHVDILALEKTKDYRMLKAKFSSVMAVAYALQNDLKNTIKHLTTSIDIINIFKSVGRDSFEIKEVICYNYITSIIISSENNSKLEKLEKLKNEYNGVNNTKLRAKFGFLMKTARKTVD